MTEPAWLTEARKHEGAKSGDGFIAAAHCGSPGDPWCAIFANAMLETVGVTGTHSAAARSFESNPNFIKLAKPTVGALATMWRGSPQAGTGHVTFVTDDSGASFHGLGGNQGGGEVNIESFAEGPTSRITGFWWPAKEPSPAVAQLTPIPTDKIFTKITATVFGGPGDNQGEVAYPDVAPGWPSRPGVALPFHFHGARPSVVVTANGKSVTCPIVDVGPWDTNDPYWETGARPQAESGTDTSGRKTNSAGIDLTPAAAAAIGLQGKGMVDWQFAGVAGAPTAAVAPASPAAPQIDWTPVVQALVKAAPLVQPIAGPYLERWMGSLGRYLPELAIMAGAPTAIVHLVGILPPAQADIAYIVLAAMWGLGMQSRYAPPGPAAPAHQYHGGPKGN